tara:strand:- start:4589 stop:5404 length:816 start_codon:yes stop_codon:yes gene_type:complete
MNLFKIMYSILIFFMLLLVGNNLIADDNHIHVDQVSGGDNFNLAIDQVGHSNLIRFSFNHNNNEVDLLQSGNNMYIGYTDDWGSGYSWGGDLDGLNNEMDIRQKCSTSTCNDNDFQFHILGDNNTVKFGQGYSLNDSATPTWNYDNNEPGGNFVRLDIHGDNNTFTGSQKMDTSTISHSITANIYTDDNDVYVRQAQNGNKTLTLTIRNSDGNDVFANQRDNGAHTATISLLGTQPTNLDLLQRGNTTQSYSLTQNCITSGGCNISVTQGN